MKHGNGGTASGRETARNHEADVTESKGNDEDITNGSASGLRTTCALIPAYNEELVLPSVILRTREFVDRVVVVDDGSTDRTAKVAELAGATVYRMPGNRGKAAAVMEGFSRIATGFDAPSPPCDAVILLDADGQHEPEQIPDLLGPILEDTADLVIGSRFLTKDNSIPAYRKVGQKTLNFATNLSTPSNGNTSSHGEKYQNTTIYPDNQGEHQREARIPSSTSNGRFKSTDSQSGFRALGPRALANFDFSSEDYNLESDMIFHMAGRGLRIVEVPISVRYEDVPNKHKKNPVSHGLDVLTAIVGTIGYKRPLLFFGVPGGILGIGGAFVSIYVLSELVKYNIFHYLLAILGVGSLALGLLLITSGLILNSLVIIMKGHGG